MKTKLVLVSLFSALALNAFSGTIDWLSINLGGTNGYGNGWLVALYEDVSKDGWDASMINVANGSTDSDDAYLGITTNLFAIPTVVEQWASSFSAPAGSLAVNDRIYSLLFNASTMVAATQYKVTTMTSQGNSWYQLPATDTDATYTTTAMGSWQAIPEPTTFLLFAMGGFGAWLIRRNKLKVKEEV